MSRLTIHHDDDTWAARSDVDPPEDPRDRPDTGYRDDWAVELAEAIMELPEAMDVQGIDLCAPDGTYLYTLQGDPR